MKKIISMIFLLLIPVITIAGDTLVVPFVVSVTSYTAVMGVGYTPGRKMLYVINDDANYNVIAGTYAFTAITAPGFVIMKNGVSPFKDDFYVYNTSWYFMSTGNGTATIHGFEKK